MSLLHISHLQVSAGDVEIVHDVSLSLAAGEIHAIMGPNGSGKSTLAQALAGHPDYDATGEVTLAGKPLLELEPEERAALGLYLGFQYPPAIPGVTVSHFLRLARTSLDKARGVPTAPLATFLNELKAALKAVGLPWSFAERAVNESFSGGEKKRLEMAQILILKPKLVILDEIDSGLDIDAVKMVAEVAKQVHEVAPETAFLIITHYERLLTHLTPNQIHIMQEGRITRSGGPELAHELETHGYQG